MRSSLGAKNINNNYIYTQRLLIFSFCTLWWFPKYMANNMPRNIIVGFYTLKIIIIPGMPARRIAYIDNILLSCRLRGFLWLKPRQITKTNKHVYSITLIPYKRAVDFFKRIIKKKKTFLQCKIRFLQERIKKKKKKILF